MSDGFSIITEFERSPEIGLLLYQIGKDNPRNVDNACSPFMYASIADIGHMLDDQHPILLAVDDSDSQIAGAVQYNAETGVIYQFINKYFLDEEGNYTEKGNALVATLAAGVKTYSEAGRAVSQSPNPNTRDISVELGLEFDS